MKQIKLINFQNIGYLESNFSDQELKPVWDEVLKIKNNFKNATQSQSSLAGNLEHEYKLFDSINCLENLIFPLITEFEKEFDYLKYVNILSCDLPFYLDSAWVNFQQKTEFNPVHYHSGIFSFVIFLQIPFDMEEEKRFGPGRLSGKNIPGHFEFQYTNSLGKICQNSIAVNKDMTNSILLFPSLLNHTVYPFYTSNDFRITISGNVKLKV